MDSFCQIKPWKRRTVFRGVLKFLNVLCFFFLLFHETTKSEKHKMPSHHWNFKQSEADRANPSCFARWMSTRYLAKALATWRMPWLSLVSDFFVKRRDEIEVFQMVSYNVSNIAWWSVHMENSFIFMILLYHIGYMPNSGIKTLVVVCTSAGMSMHMLITGGCGSLIFFFKTFRLSKVYPKTKSTKRNTEPAKY